MLKLVLTHNHRYFLLQILPILNTEYFLPPMDVEIGRGMVNASRDYMSKSISQISLNPFKPFFSITHAYIFKKVLLILFPFRTHLFTTNIANPDLYIPLMSLLTHILLSGLRHSFRPDKVGFILTRCVTYEIVLVVAVRLIGYFLDTDIRALEFLSFSGYKFVVVICIRLVWMQYVWVVWRVYLLAAFFFFLSRSLKIWIDGSGCRRKKVYFLFIVVFIEVLTILVL